MGTTFSPLETRSLPERIARLIEQAIMEGTVRLGDRINVDALARQFNVSHIPVREAVRQLEASGLITREFNKSARVLELSNEDIRNIFEVRKLMEGYAISSAAGRINPASLRRLQALLGKMRETAQANNFPGLFAADREFHQAIWEASGNPFLIKSLANLLLPYFGFLASRGYYHYLRLEKLDYVPQIHQRIYEALASGNAKLAKRVLIATHNRSVKFILKERGDDLSVLKGLKEHLASGKGRARKDT